MKRTTVFKRMMALVLSIMMFVSVPINTFATEITDSPVLEQTDNQAESLKLEDVETTELEQLEVVLPEAVSEPEDADTIEIKDNTPDKVSEETTDSKDEDITILENTEKTETTTENSEIAKDVVDEAVVLVEGEKIDEEIVSAPIFYSETVDGYEITINAEEGIFPENTTVKIVSLEQKEELEQVEELISEELEEEKTIEKFVAFDISFWNEDKEIEPEDGSVKVSIKLAEDMLPEASEVPGEIESDEEAIDEESIMCEEAEYQVFHVDDEDNVETIESEIQDEIIEFESDSFSTYVIAKVYTAANVNIYSNSYSFTDIRTGTTKTLKGSDGKVDVIVFGGVPSCGNTTAVLKTLSKFQNQIGASRLGIYVVDVGGNSVSTMKSWLSSNGIPSDIVVASYNSSNHYNLRQTCLNASGFSSGTWTMPCVAYKNASGRIIEATRGYVSESEIKAALKAAGLDGFGASDIYNVSVSGKINHRISKKIFDKVNQHRAANGLSALAVDYDLIDAADLRAAECSVFYDSEHRRPTGEACFSVHNKVSGENIAYIGGSNISRYTDDQLADLVMSKWMNSPGHKANILRSTFTSIGVGVFITSNGAYFSQDFGSGTDINRTSYVEEAYNTSRWFEASHSVLSYWDWPDEYTSSSERTRFPVEVRPDINNPDFPYTELDPYTFNWSSSDPSIVDIDDTGLTTHYGIGRVIITATPKYSSVNNIVFSTQYTSTKITSGAKKYPDGLNQGPDGNWYLYRNNAIDYSYSGLYYDSNLGWRKVTNGALDFSYNGLCYDSSIGWWKVTNGAIDFSYNGLCYDSS
ncbi:MAG: CAP domain-containing protein, partial [Lachnospiraceae bacterium]|nr:CAP domain-containing protein [Lachnospiraceae bacterium]